MRIVGGAASGIRLWAPGGRQTRPTGERVREAVFDVLAPLVPDAQVLDLYAGTGAMGLEALSRGARRVVWVERSRAAAAVIQRNWLHTRLQNPGGRLMVADAARALRLLATQGWRFDLIFCDPPWQQGVPPAVAARLAEVLEPGRGRLVIETERGQPATVPPGLELVRTRSYGRTALSFFRRPAAPEGSTEAAT